MNANATTRPAVGTVMIYRKEYGAEPVTVNVSKVTKAGWVRFTHPDGSESLLYKPDGDGYERSEKTFGRRGYSRLYPFSEERLAALKAEAAKQAAERAEKDAAEQARRRAADERRAAEMAEVKAALKGDYRTTLLHAETLEDGSQVRMIRLPVRAELVERKGTSELVIIKVKKEAKSWLDAEEQWVAHPTYANKSTSSWASISGEYGPDADTAVWNALRYLYCNW